MVRILSIVAVGFLVLVSSARAETPASRDQIKLTFAPVVKQVSPAVVNIYTRTVVKQAANPLMADPFFRRFFGEGGVEGTTRDRIQNALGPGDRRGRRGRGHQSSCGCRRVGNHRGLVRPQRIRRQGLGHRRALRSQRC